MTMQRSIPSTVSNNNAAFATTPTQPSSRTPSDGMGALSAAAIANRRNSLSSATSPSPSAMAAAATTALGLLTNNNGSANIDHPPTTSSSRNTNLGGSSYQSTNPHGLWGLSATPSSVPLLSPSELAGAADGITSGSSNSDVQALAMIAQMRQHINQQQQLQAQQLKSESQHGQPKKRPRTMMMDSASVLGAESSSKGQGNSVSPFLSGPTSSTSSSSELGQNALLAAATGGLAPSLLRSTSSSSSRNSSDYGGLNSLLSPSVANLNSALSLSNNSNSNASRIQQLLQKQQLQELQQLQQMKQREEMHRLSQLQSRDTLLQLMLQQQQQQQQQALSMGSMNGSASIAAQIKALKEQQQQQQLHNGLGGHSKAHNGSNSFQSSIDEATVANYMMKNSNAGNKNDNNVLQQMQVLASRQAQQQQQLEENRKSLQNQQLQLQLQQDNDGMPPPPPMVSAVSSLDSIAIMQMLLPNSNNQSPNQQQQHQQSTSSSGSAASRLLGTEISLAGAGGVFGGCSSGLNSSLLSPMPFPPSSIGALGMGSNATSLFGGLGGVTGTAGGFSNMLSRANSNSASSGVLVPGASLAIHPSAADVIYEQRRLAAAAEVSNTVRDSSVGKPPDAFVDRDPDGRAHDLPTLLVVPMDHMQLSSHQTLLRYQIEVFRAGEEDTSTHTRGRNKPVQLGQIGIRCRHCKVLPVSRRKRGSVYFPRAVEGFYQAAQNMNSTHLQTGECPLMGNALRQEFANLIATRGVSTGAGRAYWAKQARKLGLRNTDTGIVFDKKEPEGEGDAGDSEKSKNNDNNNNSNNNGDN